jgi:glycosyltransferase involved in cell wall biosynthesis
MPVAEEARPVLLVCLARSFGGAEIRVLQIATALQGRRSYTVATLEGSPLFHRLVERGLSTLPVGRGRADPRLLRRLWGAIRSGGFEVVDAHNPQSQFWGLAAAALARVPMRISTVHSEYAHADGSWWKRRLYVNVLRFNQVWGCRFIAVSTGVAHSLRALGAPSNRILLSPNGLDPDWQSIGASAGLRAELGWADAVVVGVVARLVPLKGHPFLFEALARLRSAWPRLRGLIVGDGPDRDRLEALSSTLAIADIIHFAGHRSEVASLYRECDIICLPSEIEGLPYVALEAAALRIPLVATAVGDVSVYFTHGTTARLVPARDTTALAGELHWCLAHPEQAQRMAKAARTMLRDRLSPERMVTETLSAYDRPN